MPSMTTYERAIQIYEVLIAAAHNRQTVTYKMLSDLVGLPPQGLGRHLDHLQSYCARHGLPPLTVLVVRTSIGEPGPGLTESANKDADRERVYARNWFGEKPLTVEVLQEGEEA